MARAESSTSYDANIIIQRVVCQQGHLSTQQSQPWDLCSSQTQSAPGNLSVQWKPLEEEIDNGSTEFYLDRVCSPGCLRLTPPASVLWSAGVTTVLAV